MQPTQRQSSLVDEKQNRETIARRELAASIKDDPKESASTDTSKGQQGHEVRVTEGIYAPSESLGGTGREKETSRNVPGTYNK